MPLLIWNRLFSADGPLSGLLPLPVRIALACYAFADLVAFFLFLLDKRLASGRRRRIPEAVLLGWSAFGGSAGALCGMYVCRHKTRKPKFTVLVPLFLCLHTAALILLCVFGGKP